MRLFNLSSGSDGNSTYIETGKSKILVDAGLSCAEIAKRLAIIGVTPSDLDAIVVTHEHVDHIKGVSTISKKFDIPVFAHSAVWESGKLERVDDKNAKTFLDTFEIKDLVINPIEIPHDVKCFGFALENNGSKASLLTDLGHTTEKIFRGVEGSTIVYLESNHDISMLKNCEKYPLSLKMRILGANGHLSNDSASEFARLLVETGTRQLVLSHLSKETNDPDLAYTYMCQKLEDYGIVEGKNVRIDVASTVPVRIFNIKDK